MTQFAEFYDLDGRFDELAAGESIAATFCGIFRAAEDDFAVSLLANSEHSLGYFVSKHDSSKFWGFKWFIRVPPRLFFEYKKQEIPEGEWRDQYDPRDFLGNVRHFGESILKNVKNIIIQPQTENDLGWRKSARDYLSGQGINNQGNVYRTNRPRIVFDDLFFRTIEEQYLYEAAIGRGIAVMPLPVIVKGGQTKRPNGTTRRVEPDLCFLMKGTFIVIEIDGASHTESPVEAEQRVQFLRELGVILRRCPAARCADIEKAKLSLSDALASVEKELSAR